MMLAGMVQFSVQVLDNQGSFKKKGKTKRKKCKKCSFGAELKPETGNHEIHERGLATKMHKTSRRGN